MMSDMTDHECDAIDDLIIHNQMNRLSDKETLMIRKDFFSLKDSGQREEFSTGAIREPNLDRGRYDLIPPIPLRNLAIHYERGAKKYADWNWAKGLPLSRHLNSAIRHLMQFAEGDRSEDHLSACVFNVFAIAHDLEMIDKGKLPQEINDLPNQEE